MLSINPIISRELSAEKTRTTNLLRSKLQVQARSLLSRCNKAINLESFSKDEILVIKGELKAYSETRKILAPDVGSDGYSNSVKGALVKIDKLLKERG